VIESVLIWSLAIMLIAGGLLGMVLPALPGPPLLFGGLAAAAWAEDFAYVGAPTLTILAVMALLAYAVDFLAGAVGVKRYGASGRAVVGATVGAILGVFFGLPGLLLGPLIGAVIGELSVRPDLGAAGRAGLGATIGLILGTAGKLALAFAMMGAFLTARFV
jgi:uncharacterized protein YqgC (DUF456 family)